MRAFKRARRLALILPSCVSCAFSQCLCMAHIEHSALVRHTAQQMYELVLDVPRYPDFLSWVAGAAVLEQDASLQRASLTLSIAGIQTSLTTRNSLQPGELLTMQLESGPFTRLEGRWQFMGFGQAGSKVSLMLDFSLEKSLLASAFRQGFARVGDRLVQDFCRRAEVLYGVIRHEL